MVKPKQEPLSSRAAEFREKLHAHLRELSERYGVRNLWIFGSHVRGEASRDSDLDVLVEFGQSKLTLFGFVNLKLHLTDLLGVKVDLVERSGLKPAIGRRILEEVVPV